MIKTLRADLKDAMKSKDAVKKSTLQLTIGKAQKIAKEEYIEKRKLAVGGNSLEKFLSTEIEGLVKNEHVMSSVKSEIKETKQALQEMREKLAPEKIKEYEYIIEILEIYLPTQLSVEQVRLEVIEAIKTLETEKSMKNMGQVMGYLKKKLGDTIDGKTLSTVLKSELNA